MKHGLIVRQGVLDEVPYALFKGRLPSMRESRIVAQNGFGLQLLKSVSAADGEELLRGLRVLEHLLIIGIDLELEWLSRYLSLRSLQVDGTIATRPDLSELSRLTLYRGTLEGMESVLENPNLRAASVHDVRRGSLPPVPAQLVELSLTDLQRTRALASAGSEPELASLQLTGLRNFDARSLVAFKGLTKLGIAHAAGIANMDSPSELPLLSRIDFESCRDLENIDDLLNVSRIEIHVWGRGKFATAMKAVAAGRGNIEFH